MILNIDIEQVLISIGMSRENGRGDVVKRFIMSMSAKVSKTLKKWDSTLYEAEFTINNTIHRSIIISEKARCCALRKHMEYSRAIVVINASQIFHSI